MNISSLKKPSADGLNSTNTGSHRGYESMNLKADLVTICNRAATIAANGTIGLDTMRGGQAGVSS